MRKKRIYVESTVISYLAARPSRDIVKTYRRERTAAWWEMRNKWELCLSDLVIAESLRGDARAAERRRRALGGLRILPHDPAADDLADWLVAGKLFPPPMVADATHLALAALSGMDYLVTWNQRHLDNVAMRGRIEEAIRGRGLTPALVISPDRLLEDES